MKIRFFKTEKLDNRFLIDIFRVLAMLQKLINGFDNLLSFQKK
jgi:hypothetical protein